MPEDFPQEIAQMIRALVKRHIADMGLQLDVSNVQHIVGLYANEYLIQVTQDNVQLDITVSLADN